jgi:hypothetical protein
MIKPIQIEVPTTTTLHVKQAQIIPYLKVQPMRTWFDIDKLKSQDNYRRLGSGVRGDFRKLKAWTSSVAGVAEKREVFELHLPYQTWNDVKRHKAEMLANPEFNASLYFVGGKKFNAVTGHPDGTEIFVINDVFYRRLTWRSITTTWWDKKNQDSGIVWKTKDEFVYFLHRCEKINKEPLKSIIIDGVGLEILERDRPKPNLTE